MSQSQSPLVNSGVEFFDDGTVSTSKIKVHLKKLEVLKKYDTKIHIGNSSSKTVSFKTIIGNNKGHCIIKVFPERGEILQNEIKELNVIIIPIKAETYSNEEAVHIIIEKEKSYAIHYGLKYVCDSGMIIGPDNIIYEKEQPNSQWDYKFIKHNEMELLMANDDNKVDFEQVGVEENMQELLKLGRVKNFLCLHYFFVDPQTYDLSFVFERGAIGSLKELFHGIDKKDVSLQSRIKIMLDISKAIKYLHLKKYVHCDINPNNIFVFSLNPFAPFCSKLALSKLTRRLVENVNDYVAIGQKTRVDYRYLSPEVIKNEIGDEKSDIYSFGKTIAECFKWEELYPLSHYRSYFNVCLANTHEGLPIDGLNEKLKEIIKSCCNEDKKQRPDIERVKIALNWVLQFVE